ncbi:hypothetical protein [Clostridium beijerinckii]|uniref:hypothetical protein n=1 Tax=Clostridium beijerinckii TaxID=1520 RepID=UPI00232D247A|nr:hypothetical protein [Clostridium beijerinckii]
MDEREELKQELKTELKWVKYRMRMLDVIEEKLLKMKSLAEVAKALNISVDEIETINIKINNLAKGVRTLDEGSRKHRNKLAIKKLNR